MPTVQQFCEFLEGFAPRRLAEDWDNVGLLVGDRPPTFEGVFDIYRDDQAFKLDVQGFREAQPFLRVLADTRPEILHADFMASGAADVGGEVAQAVYLVVPESSTLGLLLTAVPFATRGMLRRRRRGGYGVAG